MSSPKRTLSKQLHKSVSCGDRDGEGDGRRAAAGHRGGLEHPRPAAPHLPRASTCTSEPGSAGPGPQAASLGAPSAAAAPPHRDRVRPQRPAQRDTAPVGPHGEPWRRPVGEHPDLPSTGDQGAVQWRAPPTPPPWGTRCRQWESTPDAPSTGDQGAVYWENPPTSLPWGTRAPSSGEHPRCPFHGGPGAVQWETTPTPPPPGLTAAPSRVLEFPVLPGVSLAPLPPPRCSGAPLQHRPPSSPSVASCLPDPGASPAAEFSVGQKGPGQPRGSQGAGAQGVWGGGWEPGVQCPETPPPPPARGRSSEEIGRDASTEGDGQSSSR